MKKIITTIIICTLFQFSNLDAKTIELSSSGDCLSPYMTAYGVYEERFLDDINDCIFGMIYNWISEDPFGAAFDTGCADNAYSRFDQDRLLAAEAFSQCSGLIIRPNNEV